VSPEELADAIDTAVEDIRQGMKLQESCRDVAKAEYSSELQAKRYIELFKSL
jgi:glycosyltransferase involved in cell wall biosynthesis